MPHLDQKIALAITMRNLDIADTRAKLESYRKQGQIGKGKFELADPELS